MSRANTSVGPPGANGTTMRTGRVGQACDHAIRDTAGSAAAPAARCKNFRRGSFIMCLPAGSARKARECADILDADQMPADGMITAAEKRASARPGVAAHGEATAPARL